MARVRYLNIKRSDGVLEVRSKGGKVETNAPTAEQLSQTKNGDVWVWYQEVPFHDPKHLDWRKKLGGLMIKSISEHLSKAGPPLDEPDPEEYVLAQLPDNYRLYEHCRQVDLEKPGAGGNKDRRDAYLYGHPDGRKKRFRSPGEFLPHLEWLGTDKDFDHGNCRCKLCTSDEVVRAGVELAKMIAEESGVLPEFAKEQDTAKVSAKPPPKKKEKATTKDKPRSTSATAPAPAPPLPPMVKPSPLPSAQHPEQTNDLQVGGPFYRIGELVWYTQPMVGSVGLGVILHREATASQGGERQVLVQPLSAPNKLQEKLWVGEDKLYPWLSFSTPAPKNAALQSKKLTFETVRWQQLPQDDNIIVDGSIFAALAIDVTYTIVQSITDPSAQTMEFEYNGIYIGGELVWLGDAVRYQGDPAKQRTEDEIIVVHKIVLRVHTGSKPAEIRIVGDLYERRDSVQFPEAPSENLPSRIRADLQYIQQLQKRLGRNVTDLVYKQVQVRASVSQILGRVYESRSLLHKLKPDAAQQAEQTGTFPAAGIILNARGTQQGLPTGSAGNRKQNRLEAIGESVPGDTRLTINFDSLQQANNAPQAQPTHLPGPGNHAQPIDLDGASEHAGTGADYMQADHNMFQGDPSAQQPGAEFIDMDQMDETGYGTMF